MKTETWINKSKFIRRLYKDMGIAYLLDVVVYFGVPLKEERAKHVYRNRTHWIYVAGYMRSPIIHELVHAVRRSQRLSRPIHDADEYNHNPEEYEAMWWEMEYLRSIGLKKNTVLRRMIYDGPYPRRFYEMLFTTKLGGNTNGKARWKGLDRWKFKARRSFYCYR